MENVFSYVPPTHSQMLVGLPIPARLFDRSVLISPLTIRNVQTLNIRLRQIFLTQNIDLLDDTPAEIREQVIVDLYEKARSFSMEYGDGQVFIFTNSDAFCEVLSAYCSKTDPPLTNDWIKEKCCAINQVTFPAIKLLKEIQTATTVSFPKHQELPKKQEAELARFFDDVDAESLVRLFRGLAERYHFSIEQVMDMTAFQAHNFLFVLPEEARRIWEMEADMQRMKGNKNETRGGQLTPPAPGSGIVQMSPEEYSRYLTQLKAKKTQEAAK